jgi:60 kDa SS-A/Ro ribonucleoprotein
MQSLSAAVGGISQTGGAAPLTQWDRLQRDLVLGAGDGIYYAGDSRLSAERALDLRECLAEDGARVVDAIVEVAASGRAPRPDAALFALALAASPKFAVAEVNTKALDALPRVALNSAHLKRFATYVTAYRGWGRSLRSAFARWYCEMPVRDLAQQMLKQRRGRWSHADLLRMAHPTPENRNQSALFRWAVEGGLGRSAGELADGELKQVYGFELAKKAVSRHEVIELIEAYQLTSEMIPERWLGSAEVWEALLDTMPYCAMLRNLGKLAAAGLIAAQGEATALVAARLVDQRRITRAKASPVTLLKTLLAFRRAHDVPAVAAALEKALYASLAQAFPFGRRMAIALDGAAPEASTILAMLGAREGGVGMLPPCVAREDRLDAVMAAIRPTSPHLDACPGAEALVVITGRRGWVGPQRPRGMLLVVVAPNATEAEFAGADDPTMLQIVGFDASVPGVIAKFMSSNGM